MTENPGQSPNDATMDGLVVLAVLKGWVNEGQLAEAEATKDKLVADGLTLSTLEVLSKKGVLSSAQITALKRQQQAERSAKLIPGYELISKVGQGAMGAVYRAKQKNMDRQVAIKILPPALAKKPGFIDRFQREARASARVNHANVVGGIDVGQAGGYHYFVMEFVEGTTLKQKLEAQEFLAESDLIAIGVKMARALEAIEKAGLVHRDIKPDNIMVLKNGEVKLCDLGLARLQVGDVALTQTDAAMGTPLYMSPEQAQGKGALDIRSDIYGLGASLYHLATGRPLFTGDASGAILACHIANEAPHPCALAPNLSKEFASVLRKMLAKEPEDRYSNAAALLEDLLRLASSQSPLALHEQRPFKSSIALEGTAVSLKPGPATVGAASTRTARPQVGRTTSTQPGVRRTTKEHVPVDATGTRVKSERSQGGRKSIPWPMIGAAFAMGIVVLCILVFGGRSWTTSSEGKPESPNKELLEANDEPVNIVEKKEATKTDQADEKETKRVVTLIAENAEKSDRVTSPAQPAVPENQKKPAQVAKKLPVDEGDLGPIPKPTILGQTILLDDFQIPAPAMGSEPFVHKEDDAYVLQPGALLKLAKEPDFSCEYELVFDFKMKDQASLLLYLPRKTIVVLTQRNGLFLPALKPKPQIPQLAVDKWHRFYLKMTLSGLQIKLNEHCCSWPANGLLQHHIQPLMIRPSGQRDQTVTVKAYRLILGQTLPLKSVTQSNEIETPPGTTTPANPNASMVKTSERPLAIKQTFTFATPEELEQWVQLEPGWVAGIGGLSCNKPALNQRIELDAVYEGEVTVKYQGVTEADLGLSFVDVDNPATVFDRIVVGGQDGHKAGIISPGKAGTQLVPLSVADGESHDVTVIRSKAELILMVDGEKAMALPNDQTNNPRKFKLRLHLFDKPGKFSKLTIEPGE